VRCNSVTPTAPAAATNPAARWIIVYDRDRQGYYFDHELAATYPALMAILEEAQP